MKKACGCICALLAAAGAIVCATTARAGTMTIFYACLAESGDTGDWTGSVFALDPPTINESADVVFRGRAGFPSPHPVLWYGDFNASAYSVNKIVEMGDSVAQFYPNIVYSNDGVNGEFASGLSQPLLRDDGQVAFFAGVEGTDEGDNWPPEGSGPNGNFHNSGVAHQVLMKGQPSGLGLIVASPDVYLTSTQLQPYYFNLAVTAFRARTEITLPKTGHDAVSWYSKITNPGGGSAEPTGGYFWTNAARSPAVDTSDPLDVTAPVTNYRAFALEDDPDIFHIQNDQALENHFNAASSSSPSASEIFATFAARAADWTSTNNNHVIVVAHSVSESQESFIVARSGVTNAVGFPGPPKFKNLDVAPAINNDGDVAFRAQVDAADQWGVWKGILSPFGYYSLSNIVRQGDTVPGTTKQFTRFGDPVVNALDSIVFLGQWDDAGATKTGVFRKNTTGLLQTIARQGTTTPSVPEAPTRTLGVFGSEWGDPSINTTGNVAFLADVNVTDSTLSNNLSGVNLPASGPAIFITDLEGTLQTVVSVGMKMQDLLGGTDDRVITNLHFLSEDVSPINVPATANATLEGNGSGHQDGRRVGITNGYAIPQTNCGGIRVAFWAELREIVNQVPVVTEANFVAKLDCQVSGGGGCSTCLCSTDPDCMMMGMTLNSGPDFDGNGAVDSADIGLTTMAIGVMGKSRFDMNMDGVVDATDMAIVYDAYKAQEGSAEKSN